MLGDEKLTFDVAIIGGAMMGSSVAWWLSQHPSFDGTIGIIEYDPSFEYAATSHTNSCMRQQFGSEINIQISQFGGDFVEQFSSYMGEDAPSIPIQNFGYLYLADTEAAATELTRKAALQNQHGTPTQIYSGAELAERFPFYNTDDILIASHNTQREGYFDGGTVFDFFRRKAKATRITGRVNALTTNANRITELNLTDGRRISAGTVVNAAGTRANDVMSMVGHQLPIEPRKRYTWIASAAEPLPQTLPLTIDPSGVHMRSDGGYYMIGAAPLDDSAVDPDDFTFDHALWENHVWPIVATRIPSFERLKVVQSWVGHYDYNLFDQNAILGHHSDIENLILVNGFSGHGLQQAPAVGRGMAELIAQGQYATLDLSPLHHHRIYEDRRNVEQNVI